MTDRIRLADARNAGFCIKGVSKFVSDAGIEFKDFARNGISVEDARRVDGWTAMVDHILKVKGQIGG